MLLVAGVILALILLNALYVAAEFAAVGMRRSRLRRMAEDGHPLASRLLPILEDARELDRYIAVSQVGITLSSLVLGAYGQATLAPPLAPLIASWFEMASDAALSAAAVVVLLSLTVAQMILGELVPKSIALQYPTQTALFTVVPMLWSRSVLRWSIALLNGSGLVLLRLLGVPATGHRHVHSPEEIELLIAESRDGGLLEPQEQVRLHRALRLGLRTARQLMVPRSRLAAIEIAMPFEEVLSVVISSPYTRLPVYQNSPDNIVGILHTKDLVTDYVAGNRRTSVQPLLRPIVRVPDSMPADRLLAFLREHRSHQALVTEPEGRVAGLITLEDVLGELLGGVADEFKGEELRAIVLSDGRLRLPGLMRLDQAAQVLGPQWKGSDTVGAHVVAAVGRRPAPGERVDIHGAEVEIEAVDGGMVSSIIVRPRHRTEHRA
jgi:CBS domain containing-hemolysin-like protein